MSDLSFRRATQQDLPSLVTMLRDDELGAHREAAPMSAYEQALAEIVSDSNNQILVAESAGQMVAMLQLNFVRYLALQGGLRANIEGVRTHKDFRGQGIGQKLMEHAISLAKARRCSWVQLTSNKSRDRAITFYERLGFKASHVGFKLELTLGEKIFL